MKRIFLGSIVFALLTVPAARAQKPPQPAENPTPKLYETVDVRVIGIDVVVTDKKGVPVRGLTKDDFVIFENGQQKAVSNFFEVSEPAVTARPANSSAAAVPPPAAAESAEVPEHLRRKFIIFIDNLSLAPFNRNTVFRSMKNFIHSNLRPGDQAMVATFNNDMKVRVPFTGDAKQIEQTLDVIAGETAYGLHHQSEQKDVEGRIRDAKSVDEAVVEARSYAESVEHDTRQTVNSLNALLSTLAGVDGKKILVLASEGLPMQAGKEMFYFIDDLARQRSAWQNTGSTMIEASNFDQTSLIESVGRTANANGITIYALHAGGLNSYNTNSAENSGPTEFITAQASLNNSTDSMHMLADMTGGLAATGTSNFDQAFQHISNDLTSYYSLGYRSETERVDRQRSVEVRPRNRNYIVRARTSFVEKSVPTEMTDRVIANLFYESSSNDMKVFVTTGTPVQQEDETFKVPVEVHIPMESITFLPDGSGMSGTFTLFVVVADKGGEMSDVQQKSHQVKVPDADMEKLKGKFYTYSVDLIMKKGRNRISIGVVDEIGRATGFDRQEVLAADLR